MKSTIAFEANYKTAFYTVTHVGPNEFELSMKPHTHWKHTQKVELGTFKRSKSAQKYIDELEARRYSQRLNKSIRYLMTKMEETA